jgi:hypothetical protein
MSIRFIHPQIFDLEVLNKEHAHLSRIINKRKTRRRLSRFKKIFLLIGTVDLVLFYLVMSSF